MNGYIETPEEYKHKEKGYLLIEDLLTMIYLIVTICFSFLIFIKLKDKIPHLNWIWGVDRILVFLLIAIIVLIIVLLLQEVVKMVTPIVIAIALGYFIYWGFGDEKKNNQDNDKIENVIDAIDPRIKEQEKLIESLEMKISDLEGKFDSLKMSDTSNHFKEK